MAKIEYTKYSFVKPPEITEEQFYSLKLIFDENPNFDLNPKSPGIFQEFKDYFKISMYGLIGFFIAFIINKDWIEWLVYVSGFFIIVPFIGAIPSVISYQMYLTEKRWYFRTLEEDIVSSNNYNEFVRKRIPDISILPRGFHGNNSMI